MTNTTIGIITYARTGSNWLGHTIKPMDFIYLEEIFCSNYLEFFRKIIPLLQGCNIPKDIINTFYKIYNADNLRNYINNIDLLQQYFDKEIIYNMNLLYSFRNKTFNMNKNLLYKIFDEHFKNDISLSEINKINDYNIINYRQNALESFISYHKAKITNDWVLAYGQHKKDIDFSLKIDIDEFIEYKNNTIKFLQQSYRLLDNPIIIDYESIHSHSSFNDKKNYVINKLKNNNLNLVGSSVEIFQKQNNNLLNYISNYSQIEPLLTSKCHLIKLSDIIN